MIMMVVNEIDRELWVIYSTGPSWVARGFFRSLAPVFESWEKAGAWVYVADGHSCEPFSLARPAKSDAC